MNLLGTVTSGHPLFLIALKEEAAAVPAGFPVLILGVGKVAAAGALAELALHCERSGQWPSECVNIGTAGALTDDLSGIQEVATVIQHDFDDSATARLTGIHYGPDLTVAQHGVVLATGDAFIAGGPVRDVLAQRADLVDMEAYAVVSVGQRVGLTMRVVKFVSDPADESAAASWTEGLAASAERIAEWIRHEYGQMLPESPTPQSG